MKVDLHVHSSERSQCARSSEEAQIGAAIAAGLDALVFTDHHRLVPVERLAALNHQYAPFQVWGGVEITAEGEDFLVLGLRHDALEASGWKYADLHRLVRREGGFIALAHPFRFHPDIRVDLKRYPVDAMEVHSNNIPLASEERIRALAAELDLPLLCNSDAHSSERIGGYYNLLDAVPAGEGEMLAMLRARRFVGKNGCGADL